MVSVELEIKRVGPYPYRINDELDMANLFKRTVREGTGSAVHVIFGEIRILLLTVVPN
jgi:hypothetical protein